MPGEEIASTARPKIKYQSQILRYGRSIFCLPRASTQSFRFFFCFRPSLGVRSPHHLGISYYVNFLGRLGRNGFQLKWRFGNTAPPSRKGGNNTRCISWKRTALYMNLIQAPHWKNQNPGGYFGATSSANSAHLAQFLRWMCWIGTAV